MTGIFINYRTGDGHQMAAMLNRELRQTFGDKVFLDSTDLPPGEPFPDELRCRLTASNVLLVLIGPNWLILRNAGGERLLDAADDYVRIEIEISLRRNINVLPLLLDNTPLPKASELPADLAALPLHQAMELRSRYMKIDMPALVDQLKKHVPTVDDGAGQGGTTGSRVAHVGRGAVNLGDHGTTTYYEGANGG